MSLGPMEILIIILLIVILFGAGRVPAIGENLAKGIKSFKKGLRDDDDLKAVSDDNAKSSKSDH